MSSIIINNKEYNNVPSVTFNKVGGGTATYTEGGGGGTTIEQLNVTASGTYTAPTGTAYSPVVVPSGTEGSPTATKGTVSSHSITVTPSVTNTGGYISGGTRSGTAVTVSASELVSGTVNITSNGTVDVSQYASASVSVPATPTSYLGTNPVKIADYATQTVALSDTDFATWTPSTTYTTIYASSNAGTAVLDLANYNYNIVWFFDIEYKYDGTESSALKALRACQCMQQSIHKKPNRLTALSAQDFNGNYCTTLFTAGLIDYYTASSVQTLAYSSSVAAYLYATAATFSNSTSNTPTLTVKTPSIRFVCNNTYLSTSNCAKIDKANTKFTLRGELWRVDKDSVMQGMYRNIVELYNS